MSILANTIRCLEFSRCYSINHIIQSYTKACEEKKKKVIMSYSEIARFYTDFYLYGLHTKANMSLLDKDYIHINCINQHCSVDSLYNHQKNL